MGNELWTEVDGERSLVFWATRSWRKISGPLAGKVRWRKPGLVTVVLIDNDCILIFAPACDDCVHST